MTFRRIVTAFVAVEIFAAVRAVMFYRANPYG